MVNSPLPTDLAGEIKKASKTLRKFLHPGVGQGPDKVIPQDLLNKAKGLAILTVVKAGFVWSGRAGAGIVVARLPDGSWSAPSAIGTAGAGFGGQIGAEITDFVFLLNTPDAVKSFSLGGNATFGANISVAAGPMGRTAEAAGTARGLAAIYSYSKSKGLFAGVSLEGSCIVERKDANAKFYGRAIRSKEILSGKVPPPAVAESLYATIRERHIGGGGQGPAPVFAHNEVAPQTSYSNYTMPAPQPPAYPSHALPTSTSQPPRPPVLSKPPSLNATPFPKEKSESVKALFDFPGERPGDLPFRAGDIIVVLHKNATGNDAGWWKGQCNGREGMFPGNYCQAI